MKKMMILANNSLVLVCLFAFLFQSGESWTIFEEAPPRPPASTRFGLRQLSRTVSTTTALHDCKHHDQNSEDEGQECVSLPRKNHHHAGEKSSCSSSSRRGPLLPSSSSRREWFSKFIAKTAAASSLVTAALLSSPSIAATGAAANVLISAAVCDASVSVWQLPAAAVAAATTSTIATLTNEQDGSSSIVASSSSSIDRLVYLLGTAHISEVSAQLAGQLVRDTHPNAVFVELDLKRIGGLGKTTSPSSSGSGSSSTSKLIIPAPYYSAATSSAAGATTMTSSNSVLTLAQADGMVAETAIVAVAAPPQALSSSSSSPPPPPSPQLLPPSSTQPQNTFSFRQGMLNIAASAVGNAIRSMYKNLDDAGFKPGDEFAMAIQAGREINADIVLGDQDVQLTLRRLTQALAATDINKLMDPDSDLERSMRELIGGSSNAGGSGELTLPGQRMTTAADGTTSVTTNAEFKRDLSAYIEVIKTRESVRSIMKQLNDVAPALVQVMLTERDAYMAAGLDTLNQYEVITAVVGVAHQDGIEANLRQRGWKQVALKCPNRR